MSTEGIERFDAGQLPVYTIPSMMFACFSGMLDEVFRAGAAGVATVPVYLPDAGQVVWRDVLSQLPESTGEEFFGIDKNGCHAISICVSRY